MHYVLFVKYYVLMQNSVERHFYQYMIKTLESKSHLRQAIKIPSKLKYFVKKIFIATLISIKEKII